MRKTQNKCNLLLVSDELNKIRLNVSTITDFNKLINDKLELIHKLDINQPQEDLLKQLYDLKRYSECYLTLNYSILEELNKINDSINISDKHIKSILDDKK